MPTTQDLPGKALINISTRCRFGIRPEDASAENSGEKIIADNCQHSPELSSPLCDNTCPKFAACAQHLIDSLKKINKEKISMGSGNLRGRFQP